MEGSPSQQHNGHDEQHGLGGVEPVGGRSVPVSRPASRPPAGAIAAPSALEAAIELVSVIFVLFGPRMLLSWWMGGSLEIVGQELYASVVAQGLAALVLVGLLVHKNGQRLASIGVHGRALAGELLVALGTFLAVYLSFLLVLAVLQTLSHWYPRLLQDLAAERLKLAQIFPRLAMWRLIAFCLFVGFYEELLFRGFVLTRLKVITGYWAPAILISSAVFALGHSYEGTTAVIQIFLVAVIFGAVFAWRGSIVGIGLAHAAMNAVNLTVLQRLG